MPPCHPRPRPRPALPLHSPQVAWRTCTVQYPQSSSSLCRVRVASHRRVPLPSSLQAVLCLPLDWATRQSGRRGRDRERRNLLFVATGESAKRSTRPGMISWSQMTGLAFPSHLPILQGPTNVQRECQVQFFKEEIFLQ